MDTFIQFLGPVRPFLPLLAWVSAAMFLLSLIVIPLFLSRIPASYFKNPTFVPPNITKLSRIHYSLLWVLRNCLAIFLFFSGLIMMILPGQGLLTLLLSLFVADFPGKRTLERKLVARPLVYKTINWIREKKGVAQLDYPKL